MSLFIDRYKKMEPSFEPVEPETKFFRINQLKAEEKETLTRLNKIGVKIRKTPLPGCYEYTADFSLSTTNEHLLGRLYLQGMASQVVAHALAPEEGSLVIDMAAAPGGKTTHLAQLMRDTGRIIALDNDSRRLETVRDNCARLGITNVIAIVKDARFAFDLGVAPDAVLLDAPCSGNYCSDEDWLEKRQLPDIKQNSRIQKELMKAAAQIVRPGGTIVYSTCSLEPEEDEMVIDFCLRKFGLELVELGLPDLGQVPALTRWDGTEFDASLKLAARFWPHKTGTEGFFLAKLRKKVD